VTSSSALMLPSVPLAPMLPEVAKARGMRTPLNTKYPLCPRPQCQGLAGIVGLSLGRCRSTGLRPLKDYCI
jgi:hypothetical protein